MHVYVYSHIYSEGVYQIPEELIRFPGTGDTDGSEMLNMFLTQY